MSDKSHHPPRDPNHPAMPESGGAYPPPSAETGAFGAQAYGQHEVPLPEQSGYPEYGGYGQPHAQAYLATGQSPRRPGTVLVGCIMAWVGSAVGLLSGLFLVSISEESALFDDLEMDMSRADAVTLFQVTGGFLIIWCLIVAVLAVFAFRGAKWAAVTLLVMAGLMVVLSVINLVTSGTSQSVFGMVWAVVSAVLIYQNRAAKEWFAARAAAKQVPRA